MFCVRQPKTDCLAEPVNVCGAETLAQVPAQAEGADLGVVQAGLDAVAARHSVAQLEDAVRTDVERRRLEVTTAAARRSASASSSAIRSPACSSSPSSTTSRRTCGAVAPTAAAGGCVGGAPRACVADGRRGGSS